MIRPVPTLLTLLALAGCAAVPFDAPREASTAMPPSRATAAGQIAAPWFDRADGASGVLPVPRGEAALGARLRLIEGAEQSLDVQYFLAKPDTSAKLIFNALMEAGDRGVRVRVLLDDVFTTAPDDGLARVDAHPNIEVRIFNPVSRSGPKWLGMIARFPDSNRRMHNKSFTADGAITIVGGRNIADEYYAVEQEIEFADFDVVAFGPAAVDVSRTFDMFWNSKRSVPIAALVGPEAVQTAVAQGFAEPDDAALARAEDVYRDAVDSEFMVDLREGRLAPMTGRVRAVSDTPVKLAYPVGTDHRVLYDEIYAAIAGATSEVVIVSPYFVPQRERTDLLAAATRRGVRVVVVTNSLASNNHAYVHGGYFPYRRELLEAGVEIYEAKVDPGIVSTTGEPMQLTLHTKAVIIDRRTAYIGSLNLDPRSIDLNSEMSLRIDSPAFASQLVENAEANLPPYVYRVELEPDGDKIWRHGSGSDEIVLTSEPDASTLSRLIAWLAAILPVEGQL